MWKQKHFRCCGTPGRRHLSGLGGHGRHPRGGDIWAEQERISMLAWLRGGREGRMSRQGEWRVQGCGGGNIAACLKNSSGLVELEPRVWSWKQWRQRRLIYNHPPHGHLLGRMVPGRARVGPGSWFAATWGGLQGSGCPNMVCKGNSGCGRACPLDPWDPLSCCSQRMVRRGCLRCSVWGRAPAAWV